MGFFVLHSPVRFVSGGLKKAGLGHLLSTIWSQVFGAVHEPRAGASGTVSPAQVAAADRGPADRERPINYPI